MCSGAFFHSLDTWLIPTLSACFMTESIALSHRKVSKVSQVNLPAVGEQSQLLLWQLVSHLSSTKRSDYQWQCVCLIEVTLSHFSQCRVWKVVKHLLIALSLSYCTWLFFSFDHKSTYSDDSLSLPSKTEEKVHLPLPVFDFIATPYKSLGEVSDCGNCNSRS